MNDLEFVLDAIKADRPIRVLHIPCCSHCGRSDWRLDIAHDLETLYSALGIANAIRDTGWTTVTIKCNACGFNTSAKRKLREETIH